MISGEEGREARGNKESFKKYDKPKIVGSATLEIHYVMLVATLIFKQFKLFFNSIFRIYELVDFEQQWLLFSSFGQFSGECGWGQFSLVAVWRATLHGWKVSQFHSHCDGKYDTITIIRKGQFIFGGYTDIPWGTKKIIPLFYRPYLQRCNSFQFWSTCTA